jgi:hypothetical protein
MDALLHSALKVAQKLDLHMLGPDQQLDAKDRLRRELGRRVWSCLIIPERCAVSYCVISKRD